MKKTLFIFFALFLFAYSYATQEKIKVLIVDGYSNHDWRYTTEVIKTMLVSSHFCDVDISTAPTNDSPDYGRWNPNFSKYDVVVQNINNF